MKFIADVGSNFNGSLDLAKRYVELCKEIGVDIVKFQCWKPEDLFSRYHPAYERLKFSERPLGLPLEWHKEIIEFAKELNITVSTTPTQPYQIKKLEEYGIEIYKVASGDITFYPLLDEINRTRKKVILSTGAANLCEVEKAVERLYDCQEVIILHCVSLYPPRWDEINLNVLKTLKDCFPENRIGISDHTSGYHIPVASVPFGISYVEKHITIDKNLNTPDASFALTVEEFKELIERVKEVERALGTGKKEAVLGEIPERYWARRGIYAKRDIKEGEVITAECLSFLRPQKGISAELYQSVVGKKARKSIAEGEPLEWDLLF